MSSSFTPRFISKIDQLQNVEPRVLLRFLKSHGEYFRRMKLLPTRAKDIDYERLSRTLANPGDSMPAGLMADIFYWDEVSQMVPFDAINEIAKGHKIRFSEDVTIETATLLVRMKAPAELENLHTTFHAYDLLRKKRRFRSYWSTVDELPLWSKPSQSKLNKFAKAMEGWYYDQKKGRVAKASVISRDGACWFVVRHGDIYKCQTAVDGDGAAKQLFFRPLTFDLLIYYPNDGVLAIHNESDSVKERRSYCRFLGKHVFGNSNYFDERDNAVYSLDPLATRGRAALDCSDTPDLESATLTFIKYCRGSSATEKVTRRSSDLYRSWNEGGEGIPPDAELMSMGLCLTMTDGLGGPRKVTIQEPNISVFDHESDAEIAHKFLAANGFQSPRNGASAA